jgi:hypothetical protein
VSRTLLAGDGASVRLSYEFHAESRRTMFQCSYWRERRKRGRHLRSDNTVRLRRALSPSAEGEAEKDMRRKAMIGAFLLIGVGLAVFRAAQVFGVA